MWLLFLVAVFLLLLHENTSLLRPVFKATLSTLLRAQQQDDIFSKFVKSFLPKPSAFGLSQYNETSRPENFLANKYEKALLLPSDTAANKDQLFDLSLVRPLLKQTNLEFRDLQLLYDANVHGWTAKSFHQQVDRSGPCLILCYGETSNMYYGGYNPCGYVNLGEYRGSIAAFLYYYSDTNKFTKLQKIGGAGLAQIDDGRGPQFSPEGLNINLSSAAPKRVTIKLGLYYERDNDGSNTFLPNKLRSEDLSMLKVYGGVYAEDERIPYSDAMPFQIN